MANRDFYPLVTDCPERVVMFGSFAPNGSSALDEDDFKGDRGWTAEYISTGLYRVTFSDTYEDLVYFGSKLQLATGADQQTQEGSWVAASRTQDVRVWDASDAAVKDIAANANNRIHFIAVFRNTRLTP